MAAIEHMRIAHETAKTLRVTKKVMYVSRSSMWWPSNINGMLSQVEYRLDNMEQAEKDNEQRTDATDSTE